ncbi:peroxidase-like isoform X2 [Cataglyphis hispanica]|uniref:peroxidase-like isoform X2 n=1 Tax=Cataglyphis hispanica TaxID=1086592 RepID=UPI00217F45D4|nr:peroxidase-like isoform X2 [Cataglyphis hispanica]
MQCQNNRWIAGFLIAVLMQACLLVIVNTKDATRKKVTPSHAEGQKKEPSDLEGSETSYFSTFAVHKNSFGTYHPTVYYSTNPLSYFPPSSNFPTATDNIHQQIKCGDNFPRVCQNSRYRSYDGSCNNLQHPTWGLANTRYGRLLRPRYSDGIRAPTKSITGADLPLARSVSFTMFPNANVDDVTWTLLAMQYGQIITHDMGLIDGTTQSKSHRTRCCTFDGQLAPHWATLPKCFPILIPNDDPVYDKTPIQCMNFVRSTTDLDRGCSSPYKQNMPAEQLNTVTHYLDLSLVYGPSDQIAASLRAGFGGRLNIELKNNREFPPSVSNKSATCDTIYDFESCYATGDSRTNQNPQLTILQIILLREHNRVADYLAQLNPSWTDETIFQETRRIVIAEHQNIAYYEWLPIFLGTAQLYENKILYDTKNYINDYDETVIANTLNEHANAANRYFHTNIVGHLNLVTEGRQYSPFSSLRLSDYFNRPGIIEKGNNLDDLTRGLAYQPQSYTDVFFDKEITQYLFRRGRTFGSDLRAIDIQRDRDHGIASYNDYREYCGLPRAKIFNDFADLISLSDIQKLSLLYASPDDIELTVGGSLERHVSQTLVGPTYLCIMLKQFQQTRIGDRYWFETGDPKIAFTLEQLNELRKSSMSRLLCDNGDNIQNMQRHGFAQISELNPLLRCDDLPQIDLSFWKDYNLETQAYQDSNIIPLYKRK